MINLSTLGAVVIWVIFNPSRSIVNTSITPTLLLAWCFRWLYKILFPLSKNSGSRNHSLLVELVMRMEIKQFCGLRRMEHIFFIYTITVHHRPWNFFNLVDDTVIGLAMIQCCFDMNRVMQCIKKQLQKIRVRTRFYFMMPHGHNFNQGNSEWKCEH